MGRERGAWAWAWGVGVGVRVRVRVRVGGRHHEHKGGFDTIAQLTNITVTNIGRVSRDQRLPRGLHPAC